MPRTFGGGGRATFLLSCVMHIHAVANHFVPEGKICPGRSKVPCSASSLNNGDVFILDAGLNLYLWSGVDANMYEKSQGVQVMQRIKVRTAI